MSHTASETANESWNDTASDDLDLVLEEASEFGIPVESSPLLERVSVARSDGGTISAIVWGTRPSRATFLHGGGLNAHTWNTTILSIGWPAVALDLPGHGESSWHDDVDYGAERLAAPVGEATARLAPGSEVVVGQSLGGLTAIALAAARPDLVKRLVVVDASPGFVVGDGNQVRDFLAGPESFASRDEIVDRALEFGFGPSRAAVERGVLRNTRVRDDGRVVFKHHFANLDPTAPFKMSADFTSLWPALESIEVPVLLVRGSRGFLNDDLSREFLDRTPGAISVTIESGHNVQEEAPVELAAAIAEFVEQS
jgi:pimeloyl-ACP methyl ester carboxylesterase